jgi:hypothetical protein
MKIDYKKIINISNNTELNEYDLDNPINNNDYLFHYLIQFGNIKALKLFNFPVYKENNNKLNGFHIAAISGNINILYYLIDTYPDYIYNRNSEDNSFAYYLPIEYFYELIKKYQNIDWDDLLETNILSKILINLSYNELNNFIDVLPIKVSKDKLYLCDIIKNNKLSLSELELILDKFTDSEINLKNTYGEGLIFLSLYNTTKHIGLFNYLLKRDIDINYYTISNTYNPLYTAVIVDIKNNRQIFSQKLVKKLEIINPLFYKDVDKYMNNIAHHIIYSRIKFGLNLDNINIDLSILKYCDNYTWNQLNIYKKTPLELITHLNYKLYSPILIDNNIKISPSVIKIIKSKKYLKLYNKLPKYKINNNIEIKNYKYADITLFQAKFKDLCIFVIYLSDIYPELLIPTLKYYTLSNISFENSFKFPDNLINKYSIFPWVISYNMLNDEYYINPYLNNIINSQKNNKKFGILFLVIYNHIYHANILIYDFKNNIIERFEPYGNINLINSKIDDILEEELTWNTNLTYLSPKNYMPYSGFQTISDENNKINKKLGDFGGFCLAWCLWYLETKLKNSNINSKILINKLINKLNNQQYSFSEYIRNYSNIINKKRIDYLLHNNINKSNLTSFIFNKFN